MGSKLEGMESKLDGIAEQLKTDIKTNISLKLRKDVEEMYERWSKKIEQMVSCTRENISETHYCWIGDGITSDSANEYMGFIKQW